MAAATRVITRSVGGEALPSTSNAVALAWKRTTGLEGATCGLGNVARGSLTST